MTGCANEPAAVLIEAAELRSALRGEPPGRNIVVADVRWALNGPPGKPEFEAGHVPGAQWVDLESELSAPPSGPGGRHPLPGADVFAAAMWRIGVEAESTVVVCDGGSSLAAARLWWLLTDAGHSSVRVLNGGMQAWRAADLPIERGPGKPPPEGHFVAHPGRRRQVDAAEILGLISRSAAPQLVDVRSADRYAGENETVDPVAGHIPGAVSRPSMDNIGADLRFVPQTELIDRYADLSAEAVLYCGSGITAAHSLLAMESAGIVGPAIYPGSWSDWISDRQRPVATGSRP